MSQEDKLIKIMRYLDVCINKAQERELEPEHEENSLYYSIIRSTLVEFKSDAQKIIDGKLNEPVVLN